MESQWVKLQSALAEGGDGKAASKSALVAFVLADVCLDADGCFTAWEREGVTQTQISEYKTPEPREDTATALLSSLVDHVDRPPWCGRRKRVLAAYRLSCQPLGRSCVVGAAADGSSSARHGAVTRRH